MQHPKTAVIIGAGPAGLTAAYELLKRTDVKPIIIEKSQDIGGISKTVNYKGNRIDIGGHRFFSKSDRVMEWWLNIMPLQTSDTNPFNISYQNQRRSIQAKAAPAEPANPDRVMLIRKRLSRIYFLRKFFDYPVSLSLDTLRKLGIIKTLSILFSYLYIQVFPRRKEKNLEDFMVNRFGLALYKLFFRDYTEKVWGVPCHKIPAEWGAQRIKGVSIRSAIEHALKRLKSGNNTYSDLHQQRTETSLIEQFLYPKYGPGQLWEEVALQIVYMGGIIYRGYQVQQIYSTAGMVTGVKAIQHDKLHSVTLHADYFFSTMPVKELITAMGHIVPLNVRELADGLQYRDFITVGLLLKSDALQKLKDNWIYIQEATVRVGRLQFFNNWSPHMVADPTTTWIGMEFFCSTTDNFWKCSDQEITRQAIAELEKIGLADAGEVLDSTVIRMEKTYPSYFGSYDRFNEIREYTDSFQNLFLVGRNGMHKYNNSDHSMLTAMVAVDNICEGITEKANIWAVNTEQEYHEATAVTRNQKPTFKNYLKQDAFFIALAGSIASIILWCIFKYYYPYASFINGDSYAYLTSAFYNLHVHTYPIGYPKFLRLFSVFSNNDTVLVTFQYLFLQGSLATFLFSLGYLFKFNRPVLLTLFIATALNPVWLYLCNYVATDSLFISLSLLWVTSLLWLLYQPSKRLVLLQAVLILLAFTIRYNALFYPFISAGVILLSRQKLVVKLTGIAFTVLLLAGFINFTARQYQKLTGIYQFSPFSGWQMANNALYSYRYVSKHQVKRVPEQFKALDQTVRNYFDTSRNLRHHPWERQLAGTMYQWDQRSPLRIYMQQQFKQDSSTWEIKKWASMGPLYNAYGSYIIRQYPALYLEYYVWPNFLKFYAPPVEFLDHYSTGVDTVTAIAKQWFAYKDSKLKTRVADLQVNTLNFMPALSGMLHVVFFLLSVLYLCCTPFRQNSLMYHTWLLFAALWFANMAFSILASPIALRFQLFNLVLNLCSSVLLVRYLLNSSAAKVKEAKAPEFQLSYT